MIRAIRVSAIQVRSFPYVRIFSHVRNLEGPKQKYEQLVSTCIIKGDDRQLAVVDVLQNLHEKMIEYDVELQKFKENESPVKTSWLSMFSPLKSTRTPIVAPSSVYMWGGTGSGKTFIMDLFFETLPLTRKRRIHFNNFMIDVHKRLHAYSKHKSKLHRERSIMEVLSEELSSEFSIICFDEFQVTDVADAMILKNLFTSLHKAGVVIVSTSNRHPSELYRHGLQRDLFLPFIHFVLSDFIVHDMQSSVDYRKMTSGLEASTTRLYYSPLSQHTYNMLYAHFLSLSKDPSKVFSLDLEIYNRTVTANRVLLSTNGEYMALFRFEELCSAYLGPADFIHIAETFRVVFIADVPTFSLSARSELRRFITLIDCLYEQSVLTIVQAADIPMKLLDISVEERKHSVHDEVFAFDRCISRLIEMQSEVYREKCVATDESKKNLMSSQLPSRREEVEDEL